MSDKWHLGVRSQTSPCTDDNTNRLEEVVMKQFGCHIGVGGVSLGGKSVEQAPCPLFGLFFENPNIFTS
jgi:hypothetical protein